MKQVTGDEKFHAEKWSSDWYTLREEIPSDIKEYMEDNLLFELVRPWPLEIGDKKQFRAAFGGNGGILDYRFCRESWENLTYIRGVLEKYKPKKIIETGTNAGIFSWMCSNFLDDFEIHTIDWNPNSKTFVDKIKDYFNKGEIIFYNTKSPDCFKNEWWDESPFSKQKFDFAFLDAGHTYDILLGELRAAGNLNIPVIMVDDWSDDKLNRAIEDFVSESDYKVVDLKAGTTNSDNKKVGFVKILERKNV